MSHPAIHAASGGVFLDVRVIPRSSRSGFAGTRGGALLVHLHAPPVDDAANHELIGVIAETFGVSKHAVSIVAGVRARQKRLRVSGVDAETATARVAGK